MNVRTVFISLFLVALFILPTLAFGQERGGFVPCGWEGNPCQACHLAEMGQKVVSWLIKAIILVITLIFMWAGMKMVMSRGDMGAVSEARSMMTNSAIGFVILLSAWLVIDTVLKISIDTEKIQNAGFKFGVWYEISCVQQPMAVWSPDPNASRGVSASSPTPSTLPSAKGAVGAYKDQLCTIAANAGVNDCASLMAIMTQESGGNPNAMSKVGAVGLMQVMPSAARTLDPSLKGLSDAEVRQRLLDPTYNMQIGVAYYKNSTQKLGASNPDALYAAYNGGMGAVQPSRDCPGLQRWQCQWDSPGCYNTSKTDCAPNTGYAETREYVSKVSSYRNAYQTNI
jgi:hypothetical protein